MVGTRIAQACGALALAAAVLATAAAGSHTPDTQFLITPTRFEFGDVSVGTTSPQQQVTVTNVSPAPVEVSMAGGAAGEFGGVQNCQGRTLAPGESCSIWYEFTPSAAGIVDDTTSGTINGQPFAFAFRGRGVGPEFLITPTRFDFGKVPIGSTSPEQHATVTNAGLAPVEVSMAGGAAGQFGGVQNCQGRTLAVGESCRISYAFAPSAAGVVADSTSGTINGQPFAFDFRGQGVAPRFRISPTRFDFADVQLGTTSPQQQVDVTNIGSGPVEVSMAGGAAGEFGGVQNCQGRTLAVGETCQISYEFTPSAAGVVNDTTSGTVNGQPFAFAFTGNGVAPRFRISPTRFDFGEVAVGSSSPQQQVDVTNVGLAPVEVSMAGGAAGQFGGVQNCQGRLLAVGETCHIWYEFTPLGAGLVTDSTSGTINGQPFAFDFRGAGIPTGTQPTLPFLISPTRFDFDRAQVGTTSPQQQVSVTNVSSAPQLISMAGGAAGEFGGVQNCQGSTLAPGESCSIWYEFTPSAVGPVTDSTSGTVNNQPFAFDFRGEGVAPKFRVSPTRFDFADVPVGATSEQQQVDVTNIGLAPIEVSMAGGAAGEFGGVQNCQGRTLAVGETCHIWYEFTPTGAGLVTDTTSGTISGQPFSFAFSGNGVGPEFLVTPTRFDFGKVQVGTTSPQQQVTVTNVSPAPVEVSMAGGAAGEFGGVQNCQGRTLAPGESCSIWYELTPSAPGVVDDTTSGMINGQPFAFAFRGEGVAPKFLITPTRFDFGEVVVGDTSPQQQVDVTNVGLAPVEVSMAGGAAGEFGGVQNCQGRTLAVGETCHIWYEFTPSAIGVVNDTTSGTVNGQPFSFSFSGIGIPFVDPSPPVITPSVDPSAPDGNNGWYRTPPTVSFAVEDPESPVETTGCESVVVSEDTAPDGLTITCTATSEGGTSTESVTILRDATPPTVTCGAMPTFVLGAGGDVTASVADASSGPAATPVSVPADTSSPGSHAADVTGEDRAGNTTTVSCPYFVGVSFLGFLPPHKETIKAGQQLNVRFALGAEGGAPIPDDVAQPLADTCAVEVMLGGVTECARYEPLDDAFMAHVRSPGSLAPGTYPLDVRVTIDGVVAATGSRSITIR